jgi:hypothetical protein
MPKHDEMGVGKAAPAKRRLVSQAPPPIEHLNGRPYVAPRTNAESDRPSPETPRKIFNASIEFDQAAQQCREVIRKGQNVKGVDQRRWEYETKRWSEVLRPELEHAFTKCRDVGTPADKLADLDKRIKKLDCEWSLVCQFRQNISSKRVPAATVGNETGAIKGLAAHLRCNPHLTRENAHVWCRDHGFVLSARGFQSRVWPSARTEAELDAKAKAGRKPKSSR